MRLVVLSKMFNERDFLPAFVRHYLDQGCDDLFALAGREAIHTDHYA